MPRTQVPPDCLSFYVSAAPGLGIQALGCSDL